MKLRKKIAILACSIFIVPTLLIGCSKKGILPEKKLMFEESKGTVKEISMYYDRNNSKSETLKLELEKLSKDKKIIEDKKALIVKFYEYKDEIYFNDTIPYAVAYWGPEEGVNSAYDLISTKNNKYFVETNTEKEVGISDEDTENYEKILKELKVDTKKSSLRENILFNLDKLEELEIETSLSQQIMDKFLGRFDDYATQNILYGNFEE